jgi:hypothetical protein
MLLISISVICERDAHNIEQIRDLPLGKTVDNITNKTIQTIWNIIILETGIWVGMMYGGGFSVIYFLFNREAII